MSGVSCITHYLSRITHQVSRIVHYAARLTLLSGLLSGCAGAASPAADAPATAQAGQLRFLALGDSYTIGERVAEDQRWPVQLAAQLRARGVVIGDPQIIARTGWTTDDLSSAIQAQPPSGVFDLVTLLIGVNDQYGGRDLASYRPRFQSLLATAIGYAGGKSSHVLVLSIPDWSVTPYAARFDRAEVAAELVDFNAINHEESAQAGVRYVDITAQSQSAAQDTTMIAADGLHPSGKMYAEWVKLALPTALAITSAP